MNAPLQNESRLLSARQLYLVALVFVGAFLIDFGKSSHLFELIGDAAHVPLFCFIVLILALVLQRWNSSFVSLLAFFSGCGLAAAIEIIQPYFGRSESAQDLLNGSLGAGIGALLFASWRFRNPKLCAVVFVCGILSSVLALWPAWEEWKLVEYVRSQFPILSDFEDQRDFALWSPISSEPEERLRLTHTHSETLALEINSLPSRYSGAEFRFAASKSWGEFAELVLRITNPGRSFQLEIRVDDNQDCSDFDARFNRNLELVPGVNVIRIPIQDLLQGPRDRPLDLEHIERVLLFIAPDPSPRSWTVDEMKLQ